MMMSFSNTPSMTAKRWIPEGQIAPYNVVALTLMASLYFDGCDVAFQNLGPGILNINSWASVDRLLTLARRQPGCVLKVIPIRPRV